MFFPLGLGNKPKVIPIAVIGLLVFTFYYSTINFDLVASIEEDTTFKTLSDEVVKLRMKAILEACAVSLSILGSGAAIWIPPGAVHTPEMAEATGLTRLPEAIGADAAGRFSRMVDYAEALHHRDMTDPHWYVMVLGVAPAFQ